MVIQKWLNIGAFFSSYWKGQDKWYNKDLTIFFTLHASHSDLLFYDTDGAYFVFTIQPRQ